MAGVSVRACSSAVAMAASPTPATVRPGWALAPEKHGSPRLLRPLGEDLSGPGGSALSHRLPPSRPEGAVKCQDSPHSVLKTMLDLLEAAAAEPQLLGASGAEVAVYGLRC